MQNDSQTLGLGGFHRWNHRAHVQAQQIEGEEDWISAAEQKIIESRPALTIYANDFTVEDCCSCIRLTCDGGSQFCE